MWGPFKVLRIGKEELGYIILDFSRIWRCGKCVALNAFFSLVISVEQLGYRRGEMMSFSWSVHPRIWEVTALHKGTCYLI